MTRLSSIVAAAGLGLGATGAALVWQATDMLLRRQPTGIPRAELVRRVIVERERESGSFIRHAPVVSFVEVEELGRAVPGVDVGGYAVASVRCEIGALLRQVTAGLHTPDLFRTAEVQPTIPAAGQDGVILRRGWSQSLGLADPTAVRINGSWLPVIGFLPANFVGFDTEGVNLWLSARLAERLQLVPPLSNRWSGAWTPVLRLSTPGSAEAVSGLLNSYVAGIDAKFGAPKGSSQRRVSLLPLTTPIYEVSSRRHDAMLAGLYALVFALVLGTAANFVLFSVVGALWREKELGTRVALGARGLKLFLPASRDPLFALGICGAIVFPIVAVGAYVVRRLDPALAARFSGVTFGLTIAMILASVGFCGLLATTLMCTSVRPAATLGIAGVSGGILGRHARRLCHALIAVQTTVGVALIVTCGFVASNVAAAIRIPLGFSPENVFVLTHDVDRDESQQDAAGWQSAIASMPRVRGTARADVVPLLSTREQEAILEDGKGTGIGLLTYRVDSRFLDVMRIRLHRGDGLSAADVDEGRRVAVVDEAFVAASGNGPVLGRCLTIARVCYTIVGVVNSTRNGGIWTEPYPSVFLPAPVNERGRWSLVVRGDGAGAFEDAIYRTIRERGFVPSEFHLQSLEDARSRQVASRRRAADLAGWTGVLAVALMLVGAVAMVSFDILRRTREIGIRGALGAPRSALVWAVARAPLSWIAGGVAVGLAAAFGLSKYLESGLVGMATEWGPFVFVAIGAMVATSFLAATVPALWAARIPPTTAMRT